MSEGTAVRTKRMGARFFKNPPQPYMCIRDTLMGSIDPCYVNVLSWDKVACTGVSSDDVPLYGGMKVYPPRTEKKEVSVFAVMAHPDVLRQHGKNTHNPKERTWLIDVLLDFVEKMNSGVVFSRRYRVLRDRDITGELKEIWMAVQTDRAKNQQATTCSNESKVPQHAQKQHQQQQHSLQQEQPQQKSVQQQEDQSDQQAQQLAPRQEQQPQHGGQHAHEQEQQQCDQQQRQQQQRFDEDHESRPPQYHSSPHSDYDRKDTNAEQRTKFRYGPQFQNRTKEFNHPMAIRFSLHSSLNDDYAPGGPSNSPMRQKPQRQQQQFAHEDIHTAQPPQYHSTAYNDEYDRYEANIERRARARYGNQQSQNRPKDGYYPMGGNKYRVIPSGNDHYVFRDSVLSSNAQVQQPNRPPYQAYQYQALSRTMGQPFSPGVHPSPAANCPSPRTAALSPMMLVRPGSTVHRYNGFTSVKEILETMNRKPSHHQTLLSQSSGHVRTMHSSSGNYYEANQVSSLPSVIVLRHDETETVGRPIVPGQPARARFAPPSQPQYPHLANSSPRASKATTTSPRESNAKKSSTISFLKMIADRSAENNSTRDSRSAEQVANEATIEENTIRVEKLRMEDTTRIKVLRRDESLNDAKQVSRETSKPPTNGEYSIPKVERPRDDRTPVNAFKSEDRLVEASGRAAEQNGSVEHEALETPVPKATKSMADAMNNAKQSSVGGCDEASTKKTSNGQVVSQQRVSESSNDEITRTYTILKKPDVTASQKRVTSDMLQLSINESVHTDRFTSKSADKRGGRLRRRR